MADPVLIERLNWYGLVADGVVLCKDGSLLAGWYLEGIDTESLGLSEVGARTAGFARVLREFRSEDAFWVDLARRPLRAYRTTERDFPPGVLQELEAERREYFEARSQENYANAISLVYQWQPGPDLRLEAALEAFAGQCLTVETRFGALYRMRRMGRRIDVDAVSAVPLGRDELVGRLASGLTGRFRRVNVPKVPVYLDVILRPEWIHEKPWDLPRVCGRPAAFVAIDGYPAQSTPEMLALLEDMPLEYHWTTRFLPLSGEGIRREIGRKSRGWGQAKTSVTSQISRTGEGRANEFTAAMEEEAQGTLAEVEAGDLRYGHFNATVAIFGEPDESPERVRRTAAVLVEALGEQGYSARVETYNAFEAFVSTLPGHRLENRRRAIVSNRNFADLIPVSTIWAGEPLNPCDKFPPGSPALLRARSRTGEPYFFNLHSGDVGHTLIFGPTGAGKSVLLGLIAANFLKYPGAQVFAFDKGRSMQALTLAIGGAHYTLGDGGTPVAPLAAIDDLGAAWAQDWVEMLLRLARVEVEPVLSLEVRAAIEALAGLAGEPLAGFRSMVQDETIKAAVAPFVEGGAYAGIINGATDRIAFAPFTVFETETLFETAESAGLLTIDYLFRRIERRLRGAPTLVILDEAWSYLGHEVFRERIRKWLRELRKANASVVIATQFIGDALDSALAGALLQSCQTRIFLPDVDARGARDAEKYRALGLSEAQVELVATMQPKRDYYVVKPEGRRVVDFAIQPMALALLGATNTEDSARAAAMAALDPEGWWRRFIADRLARNNGTRWAGAA